MWRDDNILITDYIGSIYMYRTPVDKDFKSQITAFKIYNMTIHINVNSFLRSITLLYCKNKRKL